jgi:iron complex transport system substrate-binding protein
MNIEELARVAVDCGLKIHKELGPGLLESVYEAILAVVLQRRGIEVERQKPLKVGYDGIVLDDGFRIDLLLDGRLILEVKSVETMLPVHSKQVLTYLRLTHLPLGILMNFGAATFREGVRRVVNNHSDFASSRLRVHQIPSVEMISASPVPVKKL